MSSNVAATLKAKRKELNMSVKSVLDALHVNGIEVSDKTIYGWESGHRQPDADTFVVLCQIYGIESLSNIKKAPPISDGAMKLAKDYDTLDRWGKQAVRELADTELARMEDEARFLAETTPEPEPKIIPLYLSPVAAGIASPIMGEDYEEYTLKPEDPQGAMFAIKVQGDSMEPYFADTSTVFCNKDPIQDGDIGVFCVDGGAVIKQYHKQGGIVYLFSLNRERADADVVLPSTSGRGFSCQGRVITKRRYQLPGM